MASIEVPKVPKVSFSCVRGTSPAYFRGICHPGFCRRPCDAEVGQRRWTR